MMHISDEAIARLIEGKVRKRERKQLLHHLSECNECFEIYTESMKDIDDMKLELQKSMPMAFPLKRRFVLAIAATIFICAVAISIFLSVNSKTPEQVATDRFTQNVREDLEGRPEFQLRGTSTIMDTAAHIGYYLTELKIIKNQDLQQQLVKRLINEVLDLGLDAKSIFSITDFEELKEKLTTELKKKNLLEPLQWGLLIEESIYKTYKKQKPNPQEIKRLIEISRILFFWDSIESKLRKLQTMSNTEKIREELIELKELFQ